MRCTYFASLSDSNSKQSILTSLQFPEHLTLHCTEHDVKLIMPAYLRHMPLQYGLLVLHDGRPKQPILPAMTIINLSVDIATEKDRLSQLE